VGKHPAVPSSSSLQKSESMHLVKPCPNCSRVFTRGSCYENHVKYCYKYYRFIESISSGGVRCRLCNSSFTKRRSCIKHLRKKHLLTAESIYSTHNNAGTDVTQPIESSLTVNVSSASVGKDTVKSTVLPSSVRKSLSRHFVKPCRCCSRVFTRRSSYQNHVKWCCKRDRFVEIISSGGVRCRLCNTSFTYRSSCKKHLRKKHLLTDQSIYSIHNNARTDVAEQIESSLTVRVSTSSVRKHTAESTAVLSSSSVQKSQSMHLVKPCPSCSRVFMRSQCYQNHVKWCCKRDRFLERLSSGGVRCRLCNSSFRCRTSCKKHLRKKHQLTDELICSTHDNVGTDVTEPVESSSTANMSSTSVGKDTVESTALPSSVQKSESMHFVKPCGNCSRVFTRRSCYQNHVKWCCKRDRFVEGLSSGGVRCRLCNSSFRYHTSCKRHLRQKHLLTDQSIYITHNNARTDVAEQIESSSTVRVASVGKHTAVLSSSSLQKSESMHLVKPCPNCSRVFTRGSCYQNHVKYCYTYYRFIESISSGGVRCRLCNSSFTKRRSCIEHLHKKHQLTAESIYSTHNNAATDVAD